MNRIMNHQLMNNLRKSVTLALKFARRNWVWTAAAVLVALIMAYGSPAWAAPIAAPHNQTVPRPTPTTAGNPVATPTPRLDDGTGDPNDPGDDQDEDGTGGATTGPILFAPEQGEPAYSASVTVAQL